jgi:hypothetical protein
MNGRVVLAFYHDAVADAGVATLGRVLVSLDSDHLCVSGLTAKVQFSWQRLGSRLFYDRTINIRMLLSPCDLSPAGINIAHLVQIITSVFCVLLLCCLFRQAVVFCL